ncbi:FecR domain-containing protein [bacterium]|nr:FecR domain-containing protein [bacterium]
MKKILIGLVFLISFLLFSSGNQPEIILVKKKGNVYYWDIIDKKWTVLPVKSKLRVGLFIKTGDNSEAIISFGKKAVITISENSVIRITKSLFEKEKIKEVKIQIPKGKIWAIVEKLPEAPSKFEIETPNTIAGVRGTVFMVKYQTEDKSTRVAVIKGQVGVISKFTKKYVLLKENMATTVVANKPPVPPQVLEEKERQEWERWKQSIPFSEIGIVGGIAEINALQMREASRIVRELGIAKKGTKKVLQDFEKIETAILLYYGDTGKVPSKLKDLIENPGIAGWKGPYLGAGTNFMDPYGRPYQYRIKKTPGGKKYIELFTFGFIGATGQTYGEEKKIIFIDKLDEMLKKKLQETGK